MNVQEFERLYQRRVTGTGLTGSIVNLDLDPVEPGYIRRLSRVIVENKTSNYTKLRFSNYDGANELPLDAVDYPMKSELIAADNEIILGEREIMRATLTGTVTGDILQLTAYGHEQKRRG